jgi:excisionase family DNA binding protein
MNTEKLEAFVDADEAARFLSVTRRCVLDLARARKLPGHPIGDGARRVWRFRLSEIEAAMTAPKKSGFISEQTARMVRPHVVSRRAKK